MKPPVEGPPCTLPSRQSRQRDPAKDQPLIDDIRLLGSMLGDIVRRARGRELLLDRRDRAAAQRLLSARQRRPGRPRAGTAAAGPHPLAGRIGDAGVLVFLASRQHRRGPSPRAPARAPCPRAGRRGRAGRQPRQDLRALRRCRDRPGQGGRGARPRLGLAGAHRPPDRGAAQEPARRRTRHRRAAGERATASTIARELERNTAMLRTRITQLWQTRLLRDRKLTVRDEIENALSYYRTTFLREIPRLYAEVEHHLGEAPASFFRMGNWIGGDRDGNPNVDGVDAGGRARAPDARRRSTSTSASCTSSAPNCRCRTAGRLFSRARDAGRHLAGRQPAPRGRALPARRPGGVGPGLGDAPRPDGRDAAPTRRAATLPPYARPEELAADLRTMADSLRAPPRGRAGRFPPRTAAARRRRLRLPPRDGRPAPVLGPPRGDAGRAHGQGRRRARLCGARRRGQAAPCCSACWRAAPAAPALRHLFGPHARASSASSRRARRLRAAYGPESLRHYIISHTETVSDLLEVLLLQKEFGLLHGTFGDARRHGRADRVAAVRDHRGSAQRRAHHAGLLRPARRRGPGPAPRAAEQDIMLGYSDSNKDGGFFTSQLGALPLLDRSWRGSSTRSRASPCGCSTAAAARWGAAAARATRRSWRSRPAP